MIIKDKTGFFIIGDSGITRLLRSNENTAYHDKIKENLNKMILSASGWRKIFSFENGKNDSEDSMSKKISSEDIYIVSGAAYIFARYLSDKTGHKNPVISVGLDTRPTGPAIGEAVVKTFLSMGFNVKYHFITSAPEIMAYVKNNKETDGFIYISASHNPSGYNGIKFGPSNGAVLGGNDSAEIIRNYKEFMINGNPVKTLDNLSENLTSEILEKTFSDADKWKQRSFDAYLEFNKSIFTFDGKYTPDNKKNDIGIVADLNGSARSVSIDKVFFDLIGIKSYIFNNRPSEINHAILPEGENLDFCRKKLEAKYKEDRSFVIGYMPDNDGDRGNLVFINNETGKAEILEAQEVFALACLSELSFMVYSGILNYDESGNLKEKCAVAVNGPTSMRIERICSVFGVKVFRSEVGEANVVSLSEKLMNEGWIVRILGEGSNGGNITYPATVRDPMNTVGSIVKLMTIKTSEEKGITRPGLFDIWKTRSASFTGSSIAFPPVNSKDISLSDIIKTLPSFTTTSTGEMSAKMHIKTENHGILKNNYEKVFASEWMNRKDELKDMFGITGWKEVNYMGIEAVEGTGQEIRGKMITGGLKIIFTKSSGDAAGFIWMRGSGTEPVFRVMADIEGGKIEDEKYLLDWHREMIAKADSL